MSATLRRSWDSKPFPASVLTRLFALSADGRTARFRAVEHWTAVGELKPSALSVPNVARELAVGPRHLLRLLRIWLTFVWPGWASWLPVFPSSQFVMPLREAALHGSR
jgi:hypothetical protein